jgi:hypothetical protein
MTTRWVNIENLPIRQSVSSRSLPLVVELGLDGLHSWLLRYALPKACVEFTFFIVLCCDDAT